MIVIKTDIETFIDFNFLITKNHENILIKNSIRLLVLSLPSSLFVLVGVWLAFMSPTLEMGHFEGRFLNLLIGGLAIGYFGFCLLLMLKKYRE